jgi:hypothetical protein
MQNAAATSANGLENTNNTRRCEAGKPNNLLPAPAGLAVGLAPKEWRYTDR